MNAVRVARHANRPHIFLECTHAPSVWRWMSQFINSISLNMVPLQPHTILLGHGLPWSKQHKHKSLLTLYLIKVTINHLWQARNLFVFEHKQLTYAELKTTIKQTIRFRIHTPYKHTQAHNLLNPGRSTKHSTLSRGASFQLAYDHSFTPLSA